MIFTLCNHWSTFKTTDKGCPEELRWSLWFFYNWEQEWGSLCCCNSWSPATNPFLCNSKQETSQSYFLKKLFITRKLSSKDCNPLTEKITTRLNSWIAILFHRQTTQSTRITPVRVFTANYMHVSLHKSPKSILRGDTGYCLIPAIILCLWDYQRLFQ